MSILVAFAIDAAWEERQERLEERGILEALQRDFEQNRTMIGEVIAIHSVFEDRIARLDRMTSEEVQSLSQDSVGVFIGALGSPRTFDPIRGTIDALIGAGKLGILRQPRLREALTRFLNNVEDAQEDSRYMQEFAVRVWETTTSYGGPWSTPLNVRREGQVDFLRPPTANDLVQIRADRRLMGLAKQLRHTAWVYVGELEAILEEIETVLDLLDEAGD